MTLNRKTLQALAAASAVSILLSYVVLRGVIYTTFVDLENEAAGNDTDRVVAALHVELDNLVLYNIEYSQWDDAYQFMQERDGDFIDRNIDAALLDRFDLDFVSILDVQGELVFGLERDSNYETALQVAHPFQGRDAIRDRVTLDAAANKSLVGFVSDSVAPLLLVSLPVQESDGQGSPMGSFVYGRILSPDRVQALNDQLSVEFEFVPSASERITPDLQLAIESLDANSNDLPQLQESDKILTRKLVRDIFSDPIFVLEAAVVRETSIVGSRAVNLALTFLAATSLLYLVVSNHLLKRHIIYPVVRLTRHVSQLQESGDLSQRMSSSRKDEIGSLTNQVDQLVVALDAAQNDITESRDKALEASIAKSQFLANMSHEIRTPINGVLGMTELLVSSTKLDEQQRRYAKMIHQSGDSLLSIINDILDFSKIEAGKLELDIAPFNLRSVVEECLELLAEQAQSKGLELACDIPVGTHIYVQGDSARLRQILTNLIGNAVKFTERGEIVVRVTEGKEESPSSLYQFEVRDTGMGISPQNTNAIFESFSQEDGSTTRRFGGTGLGLSISKQLIELMGGNIGVDSVLGKGSTFWFTAELSSDEVTASHFQSDVLAGTRALIVDDNATNLEILCHQLESWRVYVEQASSGEEAMALLSQTKTNNKPFDVVLLDMHMPEMDGLQLAGLIRQDPDYCRLSLIMLSSVSAAGSDQARKQADLSAWITKPVRQTRLHEALESVIASTVLERTSDGTQPLLRQAEADINAGSPRILLVEDNPVNLAVAEGMLGILGYHITVAKNGIEALHAFRAGVFDLVLMDCQMPAMDGFEATRAIRKWEKEQRRTATPIVALTANALKGDRERCLEAGMDDYLSKPFTIEQLRNASTSHVPGELHTSNQTSALSSDRESNGPATVDGAKVIANSSSGTEIPSNTRHRILVVEDNLVNQEVTRAMLVSLGYEPTLAVDGNDALQAMSVEKFDLILMDCHMPGLDGFDTTLEIRRQESKPSGTGRIPIVAVTADFLQSNRQKCFDCGMDDYLPKPFTQTQLRLMMTKFISESGHSKSQESTSTDGAGNNLGEKPYIASINQEAIEEIRQLDPENGNDILREIVVTFCATSSNLMLKLRLAVYERDSKSVGHIAHSLKGASAQIGATLLASLCENIVAAARNDDLESVPTLVEQAAIEQAAVISALDSETQSAAA